MLLLLNAKRLASLTACGGGEEEPEPVQERQELVVYNFAYGVQLLNKQLMETRFPEIEYTEKNIDSLDSAAIITTEILAGGGPDVLFGMPAIGSKNSSALLMNLLVQDAFMELTPLLEKAEVDMAEYTPTVFTNPVNSKIQTITTLVVCPMFACTAEREEEYGIEFRSGRTVAEFSLELDKYIEQTPSGAPIFNVDMSFGEFLNYLGDSFVDLKENRARFDTEDFREIADCYRKLWQRRAGRVVSETVDYGNDTELFVKGQSLLYENPYNGIGCFTYAAAMESVISSNSDETLRVYPFPSFGGNSGLQWSASGIMRSCEVPEAAVHTLKRDLEHSSSSFISTHVYRVIEAEYELAVQSGSRKWIGDTLSQYYPYEAIPLSPLNADRIYETITSARSFIPNQILLEDFIEPCLQPYFDGERSLDQCIKELTNRVNLYLNE